jgi:two-component system, cell cycle response regulator
MLSRLKANSDLKNIPVIMLTAEAGRENVLRIAKMGVRDYLIKPFKEELLIERAGRVIDLRSRWADGVSSKRFDDPLQIVVVDDKPAVIEHIRHGFSDTPWKLNAKSTPAQALEFANVTLPDAMLVSLSLADGGGFTLFQAFKASARLKGVPVFALSVKTSVDEQVRAQQLGFTGIITKPIDCDDLKMKISRALNLDTSNRYFQMRDGVMTLCVPATLSTYVGNDISAHLRARIAEAVDSGFDKLVIDMSQVATADVAIVKLGVMVAQACGEFSLKHRIVGSDAVSLECKNYEETKNWHFDSSFEEALAALNGAPLASAMA